MRKFTSSLIAWACLIIPISLFAQPDSLYTVRIGNFSQPHHADFDKIRSLGWVYTQKQPNSYDLVSVGGYSKKSNAQAVLEAVQKNGFADAYIHPINLEQAELVPVIQLVTVSNENPLNWREFLKIGQDFHLSQIDNQLTVYLGGFTNMEEAKSYLETVKTNGFPDAFAKMLARPWLQPATEFETGIPMIQTVPAVVELKSKQPAADAEQPTESRSMSLPTAKSEQPKPPVLSKKTDELPVITAVNPNIKRTAALELQKVLKSTGYYKGSLDGYYGKGTGEALRAFVTSNHQWKKYQILSESWLELKKTTVYPGDCQQCPAWGDLKILLTLAADLSAESPAGSPDLTAIFNQPGFLKPAPLDAVGKENLQKWYDALWKGLDGWALVDPLHKGLTEAFRVSFFESQVRFEEYFISKDIRPDEAKMLALSVLRQLVGLQLERF